ncbi:hypothetical protein [Hymenobacter perfusus]|uniref:Uncharacterized protein n=1 Tax=Hymenobacter perfusus TaxID=1236770 RepID=A0A428KII7_9BACT|nr:hypothetical protein [Hymenobacter perfusus]RSK46277.1 hypothetical protein EI293_03670 [Hymenobacter perfusus]
MEKLLAGYVLNDGEIYSLELGAQYGSASGSPRRQASVALLVRKKTVDGKLETCLLQIHLTGVQKIVLNEEFGSCYYSDVVFKRVEGLWYLSLDPYGNSGELHEQDNWVIVAEAVAIEEGVIPNRV